MDSQQISYTVIGLMSGTSLDGLDIACCNFKKEHDRWSFSIEKAITVKYSPLWINKLSQAHMLSASALLALDAEYGRFLGTTCASFVSKHKLRVDFIASHGHTVFHQPKAGFTFQLGNGNALHASSGLPVIFDFRSLDVARGGEGAPLVPAGDKFLFGDYEACLNLGGIANISMDIKQKRSAFDICFVNMGFNYLAAKKKKQFDKGGALAAAGEVNKKMLLALNNVYKNFRLKRPSLGREIFEKRILPLLDQKNISVEDRMCTLLESAATEIVQTFPTEGETNVLCTGGGAFNSVLITTMLDKVNDNVHLVIPEDDVVKFKEALIFAFLGVLRLRGEVNCLKTVTGAKKDSCSGLMIGF